MGLSHFDQFLIATPGRKGIILFFPVVLILFIPIILDIKKNTAQEKTLVDLSPSHPNENGKRGPQEAQGQDVCLCLLRSDMPRGAQEEKP